MSSDNKKEKSSSEPGQSKPSEGLMRSVIDNLADKMDMTRAERAAMDDVLDMVFTERVCAGILKRDPHPDAEFRDKLLPPKPRGPARDI